MNNKLYLLMNDFTYMLHYLQNLIIFFAKPIIVYMKCDCMHNDKKGHYLLTIKKDIIY